MGATYCRYIRENSRINLVDFRVSFIRHSRIEDFETSNFSNTFRFVMFTAYCANLAAFLTVSKLEPQLESIDDLIQLQRINYSITQYSPAHWYIQTRANIEDMMYQEYKKMLFAESNSTNRQDYTVWDYPLNDQFTRMLRYVERNGYLTNSSEGIKRVRESTFEKPFAFINGKQEIYYWDIANCDLQQIGLEISLRPMGLTFRKNSPILKPFNDA